MAASQTSPSGPLTGIRVLDFCSFINGAYSAMLMGDLGAEVVKVEPLSGDLARAWGPFLKGESRFYQAWNRNKRCIALDLSSPVGREVVYELARSADVVIENYRAGVTKKLGIDYATLRAINPRLVYCSSTAFGSRGPYRDRPGYDPVLQALAGVVHDNVRFSGNVAICPVAVSDYQASMLVLAGVLAALLHRERTGEGQMLETSLLQGVMSVQAQYFVEALECEEEGAIGIYPYRLYETADDRIFIAAATDKFWRVLCRVLGVEELGTDPRYDTNGKRTRNGPELTGILQPLFRQRTTREWEEMLMQAGVPCGAVNDYRRFFTDPQVTAMEMNPVVAHPLIGPVRTVGVPIHFEKTPGAVQRAAPLLGEHTLEILDQIGYGARAAEWLDAGVVAQWGERANEITEQTK
ncbi:MAG: CoA transferase [Acidobacteria bacterium]|nr:CoA transferase [Acidobacteriota bacterium]MCW5970429.1 CoA transferase [Blastocatellales bacterium]